MVVMFACFLMLGAFMNFKKFLAILNATIFTFFVYELIQYILFICGFFN